METSGPIKVITRKHQMSHLHLEELHRLMKAKEEASQALDDFLEVAYDELGIEVGLMSQAKLNPWTGQIVVVEQVEG